MFDLAAGNHFLPTVKDRKIGETKLFGRRARKDLAKKAKKEEKRRRKIFRLAIALKRC
jgi:hypothetical protein